MPTLLDEPILSLETWRQIVGYNPYHFWGQSNSLVPVTSNCNALVNEYAWQGADASGRNEIRRAIAIAEARLFEYLGYRVGARYVDKVIQYPRPYDMRMDFSISSDSQARWLSVNVDEGYIQAVGIEAFTSINTAAAVVYSDSYGDSINDTFTLTVSIAGLSPAPTAGEIAVYFASGDRLDAGGRTEKWRIKPITTTISGNTVTITGRSWQLVRPIVYQRVTQSSIDPNDTTLATNNFAQTLDVVRRYTDSTGTTTDNAQSVLIWETSPPVWALDCRNSGLNFGTLNSRDPAAQAYAIARAGIRDARRGEIAPAESTYNSDTGEFVARQWATYRQPDRVHIRYLAGAVPEEFNSQITLGGHWDEIVTRLSLAELSHRICACDISNKELFRWQLDLARTSGNNDNSFGAVSPEQLNNPFGTRRGAVYAWQRVKDLQLTRAFLT